MPRRIAVGCHSPILISLMPSESESLIRRSAISCRALISLATSRACRRSLGCAADKTFAGAWQRQEKYNRSWDFPVEQMQRRAKTHHWSSADLDRIRHETQRLMGGSAPLVWREEFAKREARIRAWAET